MTWYEWIGVVILIIAIGAGWVWILMAMTYDWRHDMDVRRQRLKDKGVDVSNITYFGTLNKNKKSTKI